MKKIISPDGFRFTSNESTLVAGSWPWQWSIARDKDAPNLTVGLLCVRNVPEWSSAQLRSY